MPASSCGECRPDTIIKAAQAHDCFKFTAWHITSPVWGYMAYVPSRVGRLLSLKVADLSNWALLTCEHVATQMLRSMLLCKQ